MERDFIMKKFSLVILSLMLVGCTIPQKPDSETIPDNNSSTTVTDAIIESIPIPEFIPEDENDLIIKGTAIAFINDVLIMKTLGNRILHLSGVTICNLGQGSQLELKLNEGISSDVVDYTLKPEDELIVEYGVAGLMLHDLYYNEKVKYMEYRLYPTGDYETFYAGDYELISADTGLLVEKTDKIENGLIKFTDELEGYIDLRQWTGLKEGKYYVTYNVYENSESTKPFGCAVASINIRNTDLYNTARIRILEIYKDYFIGELRTGTQGMRSSTVFKVNIALNDIRNDVTNQEYYERDVVDIAYEKDKLIKKEDGSVEIDALDISMIHGDYGAVAAKPVIYLYPETETEFNVSLDYDGELTVTYPTYKNGWHGIAKPDGTLMIEGHEYSYLFWEGEDNNVYDLSEGFVVKGEDSAEFLQKTLSQMGLLPKEYNEFIVYWLPKLEANAYNLITFQQGAYTDHARLTIEPTPDSVLRVFMVYQPLDHEINIKPQTIEPFTRKGFTVVEWGGTELK